MRYLHDLAGVIYRPQQVLTALKHDPRRVRYGVATLLLHSVVAVGKQLYFHATGQPVAPAPFLRIPAEQTWLFSAFFQVPTDFVQAIVFAGTVVLVSPLFRGSGDFRTQFGLYAFGFVPPTLVLMIGTLALTLAGLSGTAPWWIFFCAVSFWIFAVICLSVSIGQGLKYKEAILCGSIGLVPSLAVALTFIR